MHLTLQVLYTFVSQLGCSRYLQGFVEGQFSFSQ
jgi:hypothetical protein